MEANVIKKYEMMYNAAKLVEKVQNLVNQLQNASKAVDEFNVDYDNMESVYAHNELCVAERQAKERMMSQIKKAFKVLGINKPDFDILPSSWLSAFNMWIWENKLDDLTIDFSYKM